MCLTTVRLERVIDTADLTVDEGKLDIATVRSVGIATPIGALDPCQPADELARVRIATTSVLFAASILENCRTLTAVVDELG